MEEHKAEGSPNGRRKGLARSRNVTMTDIFN